MPLTEVNGVRLYWEESGASGVPLVLVHGSWGDHHNWDRVVPSLARRARVVTYDRRGHSRSERPAGQGVIQEDVEDLAALIGAMGIAPACVVGNSGGAVVTLKLAVTHPDLIARLAVHEPPLFGLIQDHPMMPAVAQRMGAVLELLRTGDNEAGAKLFVETIAFGPGMWDTLTPEMRTTFVYNAPTWLDELNEPIETALSIDLAKLATFDRPVLLTQGNQSAPFFPAVMDRIAAAMPRARRHTFRGAGHVPHVTTPDDYVAVVEEFLFA